MEMNRCFAMSQKEKVPPGIVATLECRAASNLLEGKKEK